VSAHHAATSIDQSPPTVIYSPYSTGTNYDVEEALVAFRELRDCYQQAPAA
jgi:hypothetical protein